MNQPYFDVFLSYNSRDRHLALQLATELRNAGLKVYYDKWEIKPGIAFPSLLVEGINDSRAVAVLIGPHRFGPWQKHEVESSIPDLVKRQRPVIPVILPGVTGTPTLPQVLRLCTPVDCREFSRSRLEELIRAIGVRSIHSFGLQFGDKFTLERKRPDGSMRKTKIYTLPNPDPDRLELVNLTWETFERGVDVLLEQISNYGHRLDATACFGINDAGLIIATILNARILGRAHLGYIRSGREAGQFVIKPESMFPDLPANPTILLVDFEVKSGDGLKIFAELLHHRYPGVTLYFASFGALTDQADLRVKTWDELAFGALSNNLAIADYFIACTMHRPGIEPAYGLR